MLKNIPISLLLLLLSNGILLASGVFRDLKRNSLTQTKITAGIESKPHEFPFMAVLYQEKINSVFCGGSIISNTHILSAGHCLQEPQGIYIKLGMHNLEKGGIIYKVSQVFVYPHFRMTCKGVPLHDIGIIKLSDKINFNAFIQPINLPKMYQSFQNNQATVCGFGLTSEFGYNLSNVLKKVDLKILSDKKCRLLLMATYRSELMICAYGGGGRDSCQGDSGGPLFVRTANNRFTQAGIVSFGNGCGRTFSPGSYTKISNYKMWIDYVLAQ